MRFSAAASSILLFFACLQAAAQERVGGQEAATTDTEPQPVRTPDAAYGIWFMLNATTAYEIKRDGTTEIMGTGVLFEHQFFDNGQFILRNQQLALQGVLNQNQLILINPEAGAAPWTRQLLFTRATPEEAQIARAWFSEMQGRARAAATLSDGNLIRAQLQRLYLAAQTYFSETGLSEARFSDLVGPGKLIERLPPIAGEDYSPLVFRPGERTYTVVTESGESVRFTAQ